MNESKKPLNKRYSIDQILTKGAGATLEAAVDKKKETVIPKSLQDLNLDDLKTLQEIKTSLANKNNKVKTNNASETLSKSRPTKSRGI